MVSPLPGTLDSGPRRENEQVVGKQELPTTPSLEPVSGASLGKLPTERKGQDPVYACLQTVKAFRGDLVPLRS